MCTLFAYENADTERAFYQSESDLILTKQNLEMFNELIIIKSNLMVNQTKSCCVKMCHKVLKRPIRGFGDRQQDAKDERASKKSFVENESLIYVRGKRKYVIIETNQIMQNLESRL